MKNVIFKKTFSNFIKLGIYWLAVACFMAGEWISSNFGEVSFEQAIYHIKFGTSGLLDVDVLLINSFMESVLFLPLLIALAILGFEKFIVYAYKHITEQTDRIKKRSLFFSKTYKYFIISLYKALTYRIDIIFLIAMVVFLLIKMAFFEHLRLTSGEDFLKKYYVEPEQVNLEIKNKSNLIIIYVESLENHFSDETIFGENLIKDLGTDIIGGESLAEFSQLRGAHWTIGAMVATQCGIPLRPVILEYNILGEQVKSFLPNITCLGDILENNGYTNFFIQGPGLDFGGVGKFLYEHGYHEVYGKKEFENLGFDFSNSLSWGQGMHDGELLEYGQKIILEQEALGTPYMLTILTVDTHSPQGMAAAECEKFGEPGFQRAVRCTSNALKDFVDFFNSQNLENTELVIVGDHLFMAAGENLKFFPGKRTIFNRFISKKPLDFNRKNVTHFDMYPTLLEFIGFNINDGRIALGYSAINDRDLTEYPDFRKKLESNVLNYSPKYLSFWDMNKDE